MRSENMCLNFFTSDFTALKEFFIDEEDFLPKNQLTATSIRVAQLQHSAEKCLGEL